MPLPVPSKGRWVSGRPETAGQNTELAELKGPDRTQLPLKTPSLGGASRGDWKLVRSAVNTWADCDATGLTLEQTCSSAALPSSVLLFWLLWCTGMREQKWVEEGVWKHGREWEREREESAYYWSAIGYGESAPSFRVLQLAANRLAWNNILGLWMKGAARGAGQEQFESKREVCGIGALAACAGWLRGPRDPEQQMSASALVKTTDGHILICL